MRPFDRMTTLEEDFKEIGLLPKAEVKPAEAAPPKTEQTESKESKDGSKLDEVKSVRTKRHSSADRRRWRQAKRRGKAKAASRKYRKKSSVKRMLKRHRMKADRMRHGKAAGRRRLQFQGIDKLSNLLEQVQQVVSSLSETRRQTAVRSFANMAIIAELMAKKFAQAAQEDKTLPETLRSNLVEAAEFFGELAEECADVARALHEGEDLDLSEVDSLFEENADDLADGLDLYVDVTDDKDFAKLKQEMASCDDEEDDEDDEDDDEDDDDEDEDEDEGKDDEE